METKDELITAILEITSAIQTLYKKLSSLEANHLKDTKEYQETLEFLQLARQVEKQKYRVNNSEKIFSYLNNKIEALNSFELYFNADQETSRYMRIIEKSNAKCHFLETELKTETEKHMSLIQLLGIQLDSETIEKNFNKQLTETTSINKNFQWNSQNLFLHFMEEKISLEEDEKLRKELINIKYHVISLSENLETRMLLGISNLNYDCYQNLDKTSSNSVLYCNQMGTDICTFHIEKLLRITDQKETIEKRKQDIISECLIKSELLLVDKRTAQAIDYDFNLNVENQTIEHSKKGEETIRFCFRQLNKEKEKVKTIGV